MKIAVLGWGSLIWLPKSLKIIENQWYEDGPHLPVEFARISGDGRLTLVIKPGWQDVSVLYAISNFDIVDTAVENLADREGSPISRIGYIDFLNQKHQIRPANRGLLPVLQAWRKEKNFDAVIWTDLPPNFKDKTKTDFTLNNISSYFKGLSQDVFSVAKEYVENTPQQVETTFRSEIYKMFS